MDATTQTLTSTGVDVDTQAEEIKRKRFDRTQKAYQFCEESVIEIHDNENWFKDDF